MRSYAVIQNDCVHRLESLADGVNIRSIYHPGIEVVEVTGAAVAEGDRVVRQVAFESSSAASPSAIERKLSKANLAKFVIGMAEGLIAIRDQQSQVTFPAITLNVLSKYENLKG